MQETNCAPSWKGIDMNEMDDKIREAMESEFAGATDGEERGQWIFEMVTESFRGRRRWLSILTWMKMIFFFLLTVGALIMFFRLETTRELIASATCFIVGLIGMNSMFGLYWLELNRNSLARDIKRVELQIARLAQRVGER